jgi:nucleotide-binding universal stress UspA family protein
VGDLRVRLITVLDAYEGMDIGTSYSEWQEVQSEHASRMQAYLHDQAERLTAFGVSVEGDVLHGHAAQAIMADAESFGADMIIIATHGRSGFERWRFGGVADKVIRAATCNTLVIGPRVALGTDAQPIRSILLPLDGSELAEQALPVAEGIGKALGARLHLARVVPYPISIQEIEAGSAVQNHFKKLLTGAEEYLLEVSKRRRLADAEKSVAAGPPAAALSDYISQQSIGLVVMTSHGRGGLMRAALGSTADRLIGGDAPVLVVRPAQSEVLQNGRV